MPEIHILLGMRGAGRREVLFDLLEYMSGTNDRPITVFVDETETDPAWEQRVASLPNVNIERWRWNDGEPPMISLASGVEAGTANISFILTNGAANPVDQVEFLRDYFIENDLSATRVITIVHCSKVSQHSAVEQWYQACIHFSDVVLLNRRESVDNKWMQHYTNSFAKAFLPCLIEMVKKNRVQNPAEVLFPETRRMSHVFDEQVSSATPGHPHKLDFEESSDWDDETEAEPPDRYLELTEDGRRVVRIPDIREYLD